MISELLFDVLGCLQSPSTAVTPPLHAALQSPGFEFQPLASTTADPIGRRLSGSMSPHLPGLHLAPHLPGAEVLFCLTIK